MSVFTHTRERPQFSVKILHTPRNNLTFPVEYTPRTSVIHLNVSIYTTRERPQFSVKILHTPHNNLTFPVEMKGIHTDLSNTSKSQYLHKPLQA